MRAYLPNVLSLSRIALAALLVLISGHLSLTIYVATVSMVLIALFTDVIDGYLARRWAVTSDVGYMLDSLGDRAIHLALLLVLLVRYGFHPIFVWLIIFRDLGIFAMRVLSRGWLQKSIALQWISRLHAAMLRVWICLYLLRDGVQVTLGSDVLGTSTFSAAQTSLLCCSIFLSYYGLLRSFSWLIDRDHETLQESHAGRK